MSVRAVIDTNVLVVRILDGQPRFAAGTGVQGGASGTITALVNDEVISEYRDVLHRPKFGFNPEDIDKDVAFMEQAGVVVHPAESDAHFPDIDDKVFFCTALAGGAYLVTGNLKHYPQAGFVVTPARFCELAGV